MAAPKIIFTQSAVSSTAGQAFDGAGGALVTVTNDLGMTGKYYLVDAPNDSVLTPAIVSEDLKSIESGTPLANGISATFTPDASPVWGTYAIWFVVGNAVVAKQDFIVGTVFNSVTYRVPGLFSTRETFNYGGQRYGWKKDSNALMRLITSGGAGSLGGDVTGSAGSNVVAKIDGVEVDATTFGSPTSGDVFQFDGTKYIMGPTPVAFAISSFSTGVSLLQLIGTSVPTPAFTATYTSLPTSATLADSIGGSVDTLSTPFASFSSSHSYVENTVNTSVVFTLHATKGASSANRTVTIEWTTDVFWDVGPVGTYNAAFVLALAHSNLQTTRAQNITIDASGASTYFFYALPDSYGDPTFIIAPAPTTGILPGGMTKVASGISVTINGIPVNYSVWRSDFANLGNSHIVIS